ncbi:MAG TPA: hypothetical protein VNH15_05065 [Elusimicrobiota bacterium]|nr:hypothetical protein [Elusimicrobiota bacterium]
MNIAKTWILAAAVFCAAGTIASAASVNWNADPAAGVLVQVRRMEAKTPVPAMTSFVPSAQAPAERLEAKPIDSDVLYYEDMGDAYAGDEQTALNLNDAKDRVGAQFSDCPTSYSDDEMPSCDTLQFVFPTLTVDKAHHLIRSGGEVVATWSSHFLLGTNVKLARGWRLVAAKTKKLMTVDDGFDHYQETRTTVSVYLQKN